MCSDLQRRSQRWRASGFPTLVWTLTRLRSPRRLHKDRRQSRRSNKLSSSLSQQPRRDSPLLQLVFHHHSTRTPDSQASMPPVITSIRSTSLPVQDPDVGSSLPRQVSQPHVFHHHCGRVSSIVTPASHLVKHRLEQAPPPPPWPRVEQEHDTHTETCQRKATLLHQHLELALFSFVFCRSSANS